MKEPASLQTPEPKPSNGVFHCQVDFKEDPAHNSQIHCDIFNFIENLINGFDSRRTRIMNSCRPYSYLDFGY